MTPKEYLRQSYRLDQRINSDIEEVGRLRSMSASVSSPAFTERVQTSHNGDAPFVHSIEKIIELEHQIDKEIDLYVDLKDQIRSVISKVENTDEQMVLRYRYVHNYTWEMIGTLLNADARTVRRWHGDALQHVKVPDDPITIKKL
ncbi:MAG: RNA polymerase subunit sigma-70 [Eubacterium sp.]|nr:RNA polymerase subunit sigma-70 [Eubacterium sp.]MCH4078711.1 RNA polymerase subunit sigma-70 [Eubacterium sp.]